MPDYAIAQHANLFDLVYTGDILFTGDAPIAWYGPIKRWIDVCDRMLAMDVDVIVAGHEPISNRDDVRVMRRS